MLLFGLDLDHRDVNALDLNLVAHDESRAEDRSEGRVQDGIQGVVQAQVQGKGYR
jgi:hypothetical protein